MKTKKRTTLTRYWTNRYLLTLTTGLLLLSIGSLWWMEKTALEYRLNLLKYLADETADRAIKANGQIVIGPVLTEIIEEREKMLQLNKTPIIYIVEPDGKIMTTVPQIYIDSRSDTLPPIIMNNQTSVQNVEFENGNNLYIVKSPIVDNDVIKGWVVIVQDETALNKINQDHVFLAIMMFGLLFLGWGVIYALSRKISKPIQNVAYAASQIREGHYDIQLKEDEIREEEIYELVKSFKEMTQRLIQMEKQRAELLAGVTHDLKTPVTSISGLIQAVKDDVVTGTESKEFLDISLKEIQRLQRMIEDLLDYNALSADSITIRMDDENMNVYLQEIVYQWKVTQEQQQNFEIEVMVPDETLIAHVDSFRLQQIIINLLNNARQALDTKGKIEVILYEDSHVIAIDIKDNGRGIPLNERKHVFAPFYRGEKKKLQVRGLGLGLPFSKKMAEAQEGDIFLKESDETGTTFTITVNKSKK
jgi:signal transduction histidine kinase